MYVKMFLFFLFGSGKISLLVKKNRAALPLAPSVTKKNKLKFSKKSFFLGNGA